MIRYEIEMTKRQIENLAKMQSDIVIEYQKALKLRFVRKPMAYALYKVWKKYDGSEKERERHVCETCWHYNENICTNSASLNFNNLVGDYGYCDEWVKNGKEDSV